MCNPKQKGEAEEWDLGLSGEETKGSVGGLEDWLE